jgi:hypothetical protein
MQKVETWFQNHRPRKKEKVKSHKVDHHVAGAWTIQKVVQHTMKQQIADRIAAKDQDAVPGTKEHISIYQTACSELVKSLTPVQLAECERLVEEWNTAGPDPVTQAM